MDADRRTAHRNAPGGETVPALFPDAARRRDVAAALTPMLEDALARVSRGPVAPARDIAAARAALAPFDFAEPMQLENLLSWSIDQLEHGSTHMTHPRYFGLFNPGPSFPAECADRIVNAFNPQLASATTSPAPIAIEAHVVSAFARRAGLPATATGHFTSGGSEANCTAIICAATMADPAFAEHGARAFAGPPACYVSRESHLAWIKIAHQLGLGRSAVRLIETDGQGRMDPHALVHQIETDKANGAVPIMIAATAGTTNAGAIDPLPQLAEIARLHKIWFHVDAAWGGAALASDTLRPLLQGIEQSDSITIDAHKWLATTMGCGMFLTRHAHVPAQSFHVATTFMPSGSAAIDPYVTSMQWSRRFMGLRLFLALAAAGWDGYAAHVERAVGLMRTLAARLETHGWRIANAAQLAVVCAVPPPGSADIAQIVKTVVASGQAWISAAQFEREPVVRICATNGLTSATDLDILIEALTVSAKPKPLAR